MNETIIYRAVVIDSAPETERLSQLLKENRFQVMSFSDMSAAIPHCLAERPDVVLFDPQTAADRGAALLRQLRRQYGESPLPVMVMTQERDLEKRLALFDLGIDDLLLKPYYPEEAVARVQVLLQENKSFLSAPKATPQGFAGSLKEMNLIDLIQTMEIGGKSGVIYLQRGDKEGQVHIRAGKIVDAAVDDYHGTERAFLNMLTWSDGSFSVAVREIGDERASSADLQRVFEEGVRIVEQWRKFIGELPTLQMQFMKVEGGDSVRLSSEEYAMLRRFQEPTTLLQAIDRSENDDFYSLNLIKSLVAKGLLVKSEQRPTEERPQPIVSVFKPKTRTSKNKYSHIFSLFRRKRHQERESTVKGGELRDAVPWFEDRIINQNALTKAELLLIRQKFSS